MKIGKGSLVWGVYLCSLAVLLYFEKVVFDTEFSETVDYLLILGAGLGGFLLTFVFIKQASQKAITAILYIAILLTAGLWLFIGYNAPLELTDGGYFSTPYDNGIYRQTILIVLYLAVLPQLLQRWLNFTEIDPSFTGEIAFSGIGLILLGLIEGLGYYLVFFANAAILIVLAVWIAIKSNSTPPLSASEPDTATMKQSNIPKKTLDLNTALRNLIILTLVVVMGFSTLHRKFYSFDLLLYLGIGMVIYTICYRIIMQFVETDKIDLMMEGLFYSLFLLAMYLYSELKIFELTDLPSIGLPALIIGWAFAFFCRRFITAKEYNSKSFRKGFSQFFLLLLFFVIAIVHIQPDGDDSRYLYFGGIGLALIGGLFWFLRVKKEEK